LVPLPLWGREGLCWTYVQAQDIPVGEGERDAKGPTIKLNLRIKLLKHKAKLLQQTKKQNFKILVDKASIKKLV
jgi:hypothetical protein